MRIAWQLNEAEIEWTAVRAQGAGGQNINKVSNAAQLRFNVPSSSLPDEIKTKLLARRDARMTAQGDIVIKAQTSRSLERNRALALARLRALIDAAAVVVRPRRATRPTLASKVRRVDSKVKRGLIKTQRRQINEP